MPVRASMSDLVARVRTLIGDAPGATQTFDDQTVQDWLDRTRQTVRYELLTPAPDIVPPQGSQTTAEFNWATYFSHFTDWEADTVLQGNLTGKTWQILTPISSEYLTGRWTFDVTLPAIATDIPAQLPPVFAIGKVYDPYLAAAYALEMWAAQLTGAFDFTSDGQTFRRSQQFGAKITLANLYRRNAKPTITSVVRGDAQLLSSIQPVELIGESNDFTR